MDIKSQIITMNRDVFRLWSPVRNINHHSIILLHGLSGDENSMSIFTKNLPENNYIFSPRGTFHLPSGGFSWVNENIMEWPKIDNFKSAVKHLVKLFEKLSTNYPITNKYHLVGFSQGAALAYSMLLMYPESVVSIASLSGFLPSDINHLVTDQKLVDKYIYITHGQLDNIVPIDKARQAKDFFTNLSAEVFYCEDHAGHKLSATCFRGLKDFFIFQEFLSSSL